MLFRTLFQIVFGFLVEIYTFLWRPCPETFSGWWLCQDIFFNEGLCMRMASRLSYHTEHSNILLKWFLLAHGHERRPALLVRATLAAASSHSDTGVHVNTRQRNDYIITTMVLLNLNFCKVITNVYLNTTIWSTDSNNIFNVLFVLLENISGMLW